MLFSRRVIDAVATYLEAHPVPLVVDPVMVASSGAKLLSDDAVETLEALRALASLPERRRIDLALKVAGYSYEEIRAQTPGRTRTNVNKSLVKARAHIRRMRSSRNR